MSKTKNPHKTALYAIAAIGVAFGIFLTLNPYTSVFGIFVLAIGIVSFIGWLVVSARERAR